MHDIDFLPSEYHQGHARRKSHDRRILLVTLLAAIMAAVAWSQRYAAGRLKAKLADCEPARAAATQTKAALGDLQSRLRLARTSAELITYLRHPWPQTRIVAALLGPLPEEIRFEQLQIARQAAGP